VCLTAFREGASAEKELANFTVKFQDFILVLHIIDSGEIFLQESIPLAGEWLKGGKVPFGCADTGIPFFLWSMLGVEAEE